MSLLIQYLSGFHPRHHRGSQRLFRSQTNCSPDPPLRVSQYYFKGNERDNRIWHFAVPKLSASRL